MTRRRQGFALITVMFVFVLGTVMTVAMLNRQQLDIQRTANMLNQMQAFHYALGAEELARQVLADKAAATAEADYPGQAWAKLTEGVPMERGSLAFGLTDLQGLFNLNTLISRNAGTVERFRLLLAELKLNPAILPAVMARLGDEQNPRAFSSIESLRAVPGVTAESYRSLAPYVSALPQQEPLLNVNTASDTVLKAFVPNPQAFRQLAATRAAKGYLTSAELTAMGIDTSGMTVKSQFFRLRAEARVDTARVSLTSVIFRVVDATGGVHLRVISRDLSRGL